MARASPCPELWVQVLPCALSIVVYSTSSSKSSGVHVTQTPLGPAQGSWGGVFPHGSAAKAASLGPASHAKVPRSVPSNPALLPSRRDQSIGWQWGSQGSAVADVLIESANCAFYSTCVLQPACNLFHNLACMPY